MKIAGTRWTAAKFVASCAAAVLVEPSPTHVRATRRSPRILKVSATPMTTGTMSPTCEMGCSTPWVQAPTCRSRPREGRSEEHTSELQSQSNLVCRLLLEKKKKASEPQPSNPEP